jgi:hypothetical protein
LHPFYDALKVAGLFVAQIHGQLLTNLILKSIIGRLFQIISPYLLNQVAFSDAQLFAALEDGRIEPLHLSPELLQLFPERNRVL